jgi:VCBS repeat-containing protein
VNTAPVAGEDAYATVEDEPLTMPAPGVLANDTDVDGNVLTATGVTQPANGAVTLAADGSFTYTPDAGFSGKDVFTYRADDGEDASSPATVTITVKGLGATAVAGVSVPTTYGKAGSVSVAVSPAEATGTVELLRGDTVLSTATVADGRATLVLAAKSLEPGTYDLALRYGGDADHRPSSSTVEVVVEKVTPILAVTATKVSGNRARITVQLSAADDVPVTGEVRVRIEGGATLVETLTDGRAVFEWPKIPKGGQLSMAVVYPGSDLVQGVSAELTVTVRN